jgi:hypothetical protein
MSKEIDERFESVRKLLESYDGNVRPIVLLPNIVKIIRKDREAIFEDMETSELPFKVKLNVWDKEKERSSEDWYPFFCCKTWSDFKKKYLQEKEATEK